MEKASFDRFSDGYLRHLETGPYKSLGGRSHSHEYYISVKARELIALAEGLVHAPNVVLDVGCGIGVTEKYLSPHFSFLVGCDISGEMLKEAARHNLPNVTFIQCTGFSLPVADQSVDVLFSISLFHHVSKDRHVSLVGEMKRVLKDSGQLIVFEHNPFNPITRYVVKACEVDRDARLVSSRWIRQCLDHAGLKATRTKFILFLPRWFSFLWKIESFLGWLPLGGQYMVSAVKEQSTRVPQG